MSDELDARLIEAVQAGDTPAVKAALDAGADPDARRRHLDDSPLYSAARNGHLAIVELLLDAGAGMGPAHPHGSTPLQATIWDAQVEVARLLLQRGALAAGSGPRHSVLHETIGWCTYSPKPALMELLELLLVAGARPREDEESPLVQALMQGATPALIRLLLAHGEDADARRSDETPALALAARRDDHAAVDALLQAGADLEAADAGGRTALMYAVELGAARATTVLVLAGASPEQHDSEGISALQLARAWKDHGLQGRMGQRSTNLDDVSAPRTVMRVLARSYELRASPEVFDQHASAVEEAVAHLSFEWASRTGYPAALALSTAHRLRQDARPAAKAPWHVVHLDADEMNTIRHALIELTAGIARPLADGTTVLHLRDRLDDLDQQR